MRVILQQDVPNVGRIGDVVKVKDGFGRNFLVPRGLAVIADERNVHRLEHQKRVTESKRQKAVAAARELAKKLAGTAVTIKHPAGEEGKLFGSVTNREIAAALQAEGIVVDRRDVVLEEPIRNLGLFHVAVKLAPEVQANVKVYVIQE